MLYQSKFVSHLWFPTLEVVEVQRKIKKAELKDQKHLFRNMNQFLSTACAVRIVNME